MSDSQAYEEIRVSSDGVDVVKRFEEDEFPVPAIAFEFTSDRDESVTVRLSDTVPDDIEVEDLGFHPEYGSEYWTIDDDTIVFEKELDANASYTTVYGIRATGSDDVEQFLTEPSIEDVDPPLDEGGEDIIPESDDDVVKDAIAGDGEIPGLEDEDGDEETDEDVATLDLKDPNEPEDVGGDSDDGGDSSTTEVANVVGAMANQIRQKNVSADDIKLLRKAFAPSGGGGGGGSGGGADAARLDQLQSDISDLRAYTNALEEFLDENGKGDELIEDFEAQLNEFDGKLDSIESQIQSNSSDVDSLSDEVSSVTSDIDDLSTEVTSVSNEVTGVSNEVNSVSDEVDSVSEEVDGLSEDVSSVSDEVDSFSGDIEDIESTVEDLEASVSDLEKQVTEGDVAEQIEDIEQQIDDLQTWQEQIKETFGG